MSRSEAEVSFDWPMYADATFAGLSLLVPIPLLDWVFEQFFRRRILNAVVRRSGATLSQEVWAEMQKEPGGNGLLGGCLMLPITATVWVLKAIFRKLVYVLTIKEASEKLSYYWQRAFLLGHMLDAGHLRDLPSATVARRAMEQVLESSSSPLRGLAGQVVSGAGHVLNSLRLARRGRDNDTASAAEQQMRQQWTSFAPYLRTLAQRYDETYAAMQTKADAAPSA